MPRIQPQVYRPITEEEEDSSEESYNPPPRATRLSTDRLELFRARAKRHFVARPFVYPVPESQCVNGYGIKAEWIDSGLSVSGKYEYMPPRVGCGTAGSDCAYCVADNNDRAARLHRAPPAAHNASVGKHPTNLLALEKVLGRRLRNREFVYLIQNVGNVGVEGMRTALSEHEAYSRRNHDAEEDRRLQHAISSLHAEYDASVRERTTRAANVRKKERAMLSAMRCDPQPVSFEDDEVRDGIYRRKSPSHGVPFLASKGWKRSHRMVGIEVEHNQAADLSTWVKQWNGAVHSDGSCGWEAVTTPIAGDRILPCLVQLTDLLKAQQVSADGRCSVHVHVDATDVTWACMQRLLRVYAIVEPLLYAIGGQHRAQSRYAAPCGVAYSEAARCEDAKEAILWVAMAGSLNGQKGRVLARQRMGKKDGGRYRGLNIMPWAAGRRVMAPDTTIEFRIHRNCLDGKRIAGWASLLASLVDFAVNSSDAEVTALPKSALRTLVMACPDDRKWILSRVKAWRGATTAVTREDTWTEAGAIVPRRTISARKGWSICAV